MERVGIDPHRDDGFVHQSLGDPVQANERTREQLRRAKVFLAAGDYRRAVEACLREVSDSPSVESYVYITYVYQALDGYIEHLANTDRWVGIEQLYVNLTFQGPQDLVGFRRKYWRASQRKLSKAAYNDSRTSPLPWLRA